MPYRVESFKPEHGQMIEAQAAQRSAAGLVSHLTAEEWAALSTQGFSFSGFRDDVLLVVAGVIPQWRGRALAWSLLSTHVGPADMVWLHRRVSGVLDDLQRDALHQRVEATAQVGFRAGHRWLRMLGFEPEGLMRSFDPMGHDHVLYSRIRRVA